MKLHVVNGFLGSGKTTAIQLACMELSKKNIIAGVITNDQGMKLVDSIFFKKQRIPVRQVVNGCFCCNYTKLENSIASLVETNQPDVIFAETVGSCADIVATVIKPLLQFHADAQITFSVFSDARMLHFLLNNKSNFFEENIIYIFFKQLEEAAIIIINKIDLIAIEQLNELKQMLQEKYAGKTLLYQNSMNEESVAQWLGVLDDYKPANTLQSLDIDYDLYGSGEASLAWFDQELKIRSVGNNALQEAVGLINNIYKKICGHNYPIGHLKFILNGEKKISFTSATDPEITVDITSKKTHACNLLINARIQTDPEMLAQLISDAIKETETQSGGKITTQSLSSFRPGFPKPEHRIAN
jgi:Ni2+-binding GTPase involved in maturation of urease and hydrogenase